MLTPEETPLPHLVSAVFVDHLKFAYRDRTEDVESALCDLFATYWADLDAPYDAAHQSVLVSDRAGNFSESRAWSCRGLGMFRALTPSRSTRGVGHVVIDGQSCRLVRPEFWHALSVLGQSRGWTVKRLDAAVDDDSRTLSPEVLRSMYDRGDLSHRLGGAKPMFDPRYPVRGLDCVGWTVYRGTREADSCFAYARVYDKHAEQLAKFGAAIAGAVPVGRVRIEIEWKTQKRGKRVTWQMVATPAPYFADDCALMESRAGGVKPVPVGRVVRDRQENALTELLARCRYAYGAYIDQAFWAYGGDDDAARLLVHMLRRPVEKPPIPGVVEACGGGVPDRDFAGHLVDD